MSCQKKTLHSLKPLEVQSAELMSRLCMLLLYACYGVCLSVANDEDLVVADELAEAIVPSGRRSDVRDGSVLVVKAYCLARNNRSESLAGESSHSAFSHLDLLIESEDDLCTLLVHVLSAYHIRSRVEKHHIVLCAAIDIEVQCVGVWLQRYIILYIMYEKST